MPHDGTGIERTQRHGLLAPAEADRCKPRRLLGRRDWLRRPSQTSPPSTSNGSRVVYGRFAEPVPCRSASTECTAAQCCSARAGTRQRSDRIYLVRERGQRRLVHVLSSIRRWRPLGQDGELLVCASRWIDFRGPSPGSRDSRARPSSDAADRTGLGTGRCARPLIEGRPSAKQGRQCRRTALPTSGGSARRRAELSRRPNVNDSKVRESGERWDAGVATCTAVARVTFLRG